MSTSTPVSRTAVLETAAELFAAQGYRGTSMKDLAAALGVQAPSLYHHVSSKQDALFTVMDLAMDRALHALDQALHNLDDVSARLRAATQSLVLDFLRNPAEVTVCNTEIRSLEEPYRSSIIRKRDQYGARVRTIIERGRASGRFQTPVPQIASYAVLEMGNSAKAWFRPDGEFTAVEVAQWYGEFALRIVDDVKQPAGSSPVSLTCPGYTTD